MATRNRVFRGDRLKEVRDSRQMSQEDLGRASDVASMQIYRYENGKVEPTPDIVVKLASALEVTTDYLLGLVDTPHEYLTVQELSPDERRLLSAYRRGDLRDAMMVLARESSDS